MCGLGVTERREMKKRILKSVYEVLGGFPREQCVKSTRTNMANDLRIELWCAQSTAQVSEGTLGYTQVEHTKIALQSLWKLNWNLSH
jgi:hypothetical protein